MKDGTASQTARSVAAHRLEFERVAADYGDRAADRSLTADVADGQQPSRGRMREYLRARTAFFDRVVTGALDGGCSQVVIGGAGYDGRALRYARPGVAWFELDHPATQADKVARVARLGLERGQVRFIPADFTADPIAEPLLAAGLDPASPTLFLLEGVAVYLERPVVERVLAAFRQVAADGSELAISVSVATSTSQSRSRFQQRVAELGEPARSQFTPDQARDLLALGPRLRLSRHQAPERPAGRRACCSPRPPCPVRRSARPVRVPIWRRPRARPRLRPRHRPPGVLRSDLASTPADGARRLPPALSQLCCPPPWSPSRSRPTTRPSTVSRTAPPTAARRPARPPTRPGSPPC